VNSKFAILTLLTIGVGMPFASAATATDQATRAKFTAGYLQSPLTFEMNEGQSDPQVKALARGSRYGLFLTSDESVFVLDPGAKDAAVVRVRAIGANPSPQVSGMDRLASISNYYLGQDQSKWRKKVANYARVKFDSVYPGIDLIYYGNQAQLEYDYVVAPGGDPNSIRLAVEGARKLRIDRNGDLVLETSHGAISQHKPVIYQEVNGTRREIAGSFLVRGNRVSFKVGDYDRSKDLVIDPSFAFITYLGGSGTDQGLALTITYATGFTLVTGSTASANFPIATLPPCPPTPVSLCTSTGLTSYPYTGETDGFLAVFNSAGSKLLNSTYVGGPDGVNVVTSIAIDNQEVPGVLYVAGYTTSPHFDVVNAAQPTYHGDTDGWVAQILLDVTVDSLIPPYAATINTSVGFATYLGGTGEDEITGITMDQNSKDVFVTGFTTSTNFPVTTGALQSTLIGAQDAFVARYACGAVINPDNGTPYCSSVTPETTPAGTKLYATYYGKGTVLASGIAVYTDTANALTAYISGTIGKTDSYGFLAAIGETVSGGVITGTTNPFTKYVGSATTLTKANAVTTDCHGHIYITGNTNDAALTLVKPVQINYHGGGNDAFVASYNSSGTPTFVSYFGGKGYDVANGIAVSLLPVTEACPATPTINLFIAGKTTGELPIVVPTGSSVPQPTYGGGASDGFVAMFTSTNYGHYTETYSTYVGGTGADDIYGLSVGSSGNARFTGISNSTSGLATPGAYQTTNAGGYDAFVGQINTTP
jgi:hypothetical protein